MTERFSKAARSERLLSEWSFIEYWARQGTKDIIRVIRQSGGLVERISWETTDSGALIV
jgi:hypothetical protein